LVRGIPLGLFTARRPPAAGSWTSLYSASLRTVPFTVALACSHHEARPFVDASSDASTADVQPQTQPEASAPDATSAPSPDAQAPATPFADWLRARLPSGGAVVEGEGAVRVVHTVQSGETAISIAKAYLDLTDIYKATDLATEIAKRLGAPASGSGAITPGSKIEIPHLIAAPYKDPEHDRIGWPADRALRGVFITGPYAGVLWVDVLDKLAARKMNAVVIDSKDYEGPVSYPTKAKIAVEISAAGSSPPIPDLARAYRFAHARGIVVIARIPCFHDPLAQKKAKRLSIMGNWGGPYNNGWTDPMNEEAQEYVMELAQEAVDAGADEIQLDYIRFPVVGEGIEHTKLPPIPERSKKIKEFVSRVKELVHKQGVKLSLDIFGVTATGEQSDIDKLGQDIGTIGGEADALSPMVYPSHYNNGYLGFAEPGRHPEIVGIGTKAALKKL
jgi:hypothetical protein